MAIRATRREPTLEERIKAMFQQNVEEALKEEAKRELASQAVSQFPETTAAVGEVVPNFLNPFSEAQAAASATTTPTVTVAADGTTTGVAAPTAGLGALKTAGLGLAAQGMSLGQRELEKNLGIQNNDVKKAEGLGVGLGSSAVNAVRTPERIQAELLGKEDPVFLGSKAASLAVNPSMGSLLPGGLAALGPMGILAGIVGGNLAKSVFGKSAASKERSFRDAFRDSLIKQGIASKGELGAEIALADGSKFQLADEFKGPDGKQVKNYRTDNFGTSEKGVATGLGAEVVGLADVLSTSFLGGRGKKQQDITSMLSNAAMSNANGNRDVALANLIGFGKQLGLSGEDLRARVSQLLEQKKLEQDVATALLGGIGTLEGAGLSRNNPQRQATAQRIQGMGK